MAKMRMLEKVAHAHDSHFYDWLKYPSLRRCYNMA
jgi:hypothetical protein